jgi:hypothetical protein
MVLRHFRKRTSASRILRACRHTRKYGTFTICLAVALREHGLDVSFYSDNDPDPKYLERIVMRRARRIGVRLERPLSVEELARRVSGRQIAVVFFDGHEGLGHFSPLIGSRNGRFLLPNWDEDMMAAHDFARRWSAPEVLRQCIIVSRPKVPRANTRKSEVN